jgi:hypothetical protein
MLTTSLHWLTQVSKVRWFSFIEIVLEFISLAVFVAAELAARVARGCPAGRC